jgi:ubiquinone biosynthesis protein COQ9
VYAATVLFWLGDASDQHVDTWGFLDRRIENVMQFEKLKANLRQNRFGQAVLAGPLKLLERVSAPNRDTALPGRG